MPDLGFCYVESQANRWPKMRWLEQAAQSLGYRTRRVRTLADLRAADRECGAILFQHKGCAFSRPEFEAALRERGTARRIQLWWDLLSTDPKRTLPEQGYVRIFGDIMREMDCVYVKEPVEPVRELGISAEFMEQAAPSSLGSCEHQEHTEYDVLLFGSKVGAYRQRHRDALALMRAGFRVAWAGSGGSAPRGIENLPWCPPMDLPKLMSRADVVLCVDFTHAVPGYCSDRLWLALGAGAVVVRRFTEGVPNVGQINYRDTSELVDTVRRWTAQPAAVRRKRGMEAREIVMTEHIYERRLEAML